MKRRILNIIKAGIAIAMTNSNSIYGIPNNNDGLVFVPKDYKYYKRNKAESKKCKSCKKFGIGQYCVKYVNPLTAVCEYYQPKRKKNNYGNNFK